MQVEAVTHVCRQGVCRMKRIRPIHQIESLDEATLMQLEDEFLKAYTTPTKKESFLRRVALIYKGHYLKTFLAVFLCVFSSHVMWE